MTPWGYLERHRDLGAHQTCPAQHTRSPYASEQHSARVPNGCPRASLFLCNLSCMPLMKLAAEKVPLAIASRWLRLSQGGLQGSRANTNGTSQSAGKPRVHHACEQPQDHASAQACTHVTRMCKRTQPAKLHVCITGTHPCVAAILATSTSGALLIHLIHLSHD